MKIKCTKELKSITFNSITKDDLNEDCLVLLDNGLYLKYIGEVDIRKNNVHLFKTLWSPFATTRWIEMNNEKITKILVVLIK